jgi:hypothetical protein
MSADDLLLEEAAWQVIWVASPPKPWPGINHDASGRITGLCGSPAQAHRAGVAEALAFGETGELLRLADELAEADHWAMLILGQLLSSTALTQPNPRAERQGWQCGKCHTPDVAFAGSRNAPSTTQLNHEIQTRSERNGQNDQPTGTN